MLASLKKFTLHWSVRRIARTLWLTALILIGAAAYGQTDKRAEHQTPTLLVMGDSLSAAYGLPQARGWVALLEQHIKDEKLNFKVVNASISGETTAAGRARLGALLQTHRPRIVLIELGANDGLRGLPITAMRQNLSAMIASSLAAEARVVLIGMRLPPNYGKRYAQYFYESFELLANEHRVNIVPFLLEGFAQDLSQFQADRIHPNETAQPRMLNNVWRELAPLLKQATQ